MPFYKWERSDPFKDYANDRVVETDEVVELAEQIANPQAGFTEVEEPDNGDTNPGDETGEAASESAESDGTDYAAMDYAELRELAMEADTEEINGRSSKDDIIAYLSEE